MLCESCKQNQATVYVSGVVNGQKTEHYLCDECVKGNQKDMGPQGVLFNNFISELMKIALEEGYLKSPENSHQKTCSCCGLSLKEFLQIGRFGCKECYTTFNNELKNAFINVHGNTKHVGKTISLEEDTHNFLTPAQSQKEELDKLQEALQKSIKEEAYEEAASLRDRIRALKKEEAN